MWKTPVLPSWKGNKLIPQPGMIYSQSGFRDSYLKGRKMRIGKGSNTDFWLDAWCGDIPLMEKFPELYEICNDQKITVERVAWKNWRLSFRRWLDARLQEQWRMLSDLFHSCALNDDEDSPIWRWEKTGLFSVKTIYSHLCSNEVGTHHNDIWNAKIPLKIKIWMWLIYHNAIQTKDNLLKRNWSGDQKCAFCNENETLPLLFFDCSMAKYVWSMVAYVLGARCRPASMEQFWFWIKSILKEKKEFSHGWALGHWRLG